jgi:N6-adenosine-specific RNA methylase IME4
MAGVFAELSPPYSTIVADPPWSYEDGWPEFHDRAGVEHRRRPLPYSAMSLDAITALPIAGLAASDAHLYLWTTNRYLRAAFGVAEAWGFTPSQTLVWCKPPMGIGPGGAFSITTEFVIFARRGKLGQLQRVDSTWWQWSRRAHSQKPPGFLDLVETVSPGPRVELFSREPRLGWDSWGHGYEIGAAS